MIENITNIAGVKWVTVALYVCIHSANRSCRMSSFAGTSNVAPSQSGVKTSL